MTEGLLVNPTPEEDKVKTLDDWVKRYGALEQPDWEEARAQLQALKEEMARYPGFLLPSR